MVVDVVAAPVLSYAREVFSGAREYPLLVPLVPGCGAVGRVRAAGPDRTRLQAGEWVFCDPTVRSRDDAVSPDLMLQGWNAHGEGARRLQAHYRHGPFAERVLVPMENAVRLGPIESSDAGRWRSLNTLLVPLRRPSQQGCRRARPRWSAALALRPHGTVVLMGGIGGELGFPTGI